MSQTELNWRTSYDSKRPGYYHSDIHLNASNSSSIYTSNPSMLDNDDDDARLINRKRPLLDSQALQNIQRKISKQKIAAEQRIEQIHGDHMFESSSLQNLHYSPHRRQHSPIARSPPSSHSFPSEPNISLRHSNGSRMLHGNNDIILSNGFEHQTFHQPHTRKITKITPKENYSLSHNRAVQPRSASATVGSTKKQESKDILPPPNDTQRLKSVRRHEPAHVSSGPRAKTSLIAPDSWKTDPANSKKLLKKKPTTEVTSKPTVTDDSAIPIIEQLSTQNSQPIKKPKRAKSASKPIITEKVPIKPPPKPEKTKEEKKLESEKIKKYMEEKRQELEKKLLIEKELKSVQEKERQERLKKLNEQIKKVAQQPLPSSLIKKSSASLPQKDLTDQSRERLLQILGPKPNDELPIESHKETPIEEALILERSPSPSSSSSSDSIVEIQPPKIHNQSVVRSRSEPPIHNIDNAFEQRNQNLLRWAHNLTRDCDVIENKFKYIRPDGTQAFDIIPASFQQLQHNDGNLRTQTPIIITNNEKIDPEPIIASKILRPSGRLSHLNQNQTSEYQNQKLPGVGNLRDPILEQRIKRDRAAAKIQATYRGYTVRKSLSWINEKQNRLNSEANKRPLRKPKKTSSYARDIRDTPAINFDLRFSDDNFTIGSTLLRQYQRNGTNIMPTRNSSISEKSRRQQTPPPPPTKQKVQRPTTIQTYSDDYENMTSTVSSIPTNHKQSPQKPRVIPQPLLNTQSTESSTSSSPSTSTSVTPTPTPEPPVSLKVQRRRSFSPPLTPQMSPDHVQPFHNHSQAPRPPPTTTTHRVVDERRYSPDALERQLNAELHLLDGVEASMKQVEHMERLRSVALAQQEVVSLAQVLRNKPTEESVSQQQTRRPPIRKTSSSSSSSSSQSSPSVPDRKHHSPPPQQSKTKPSHRRTSSSSSSSSISESILTDREKDVRKKFHNETELQEYEKRLKNIENKVRQLAKHELEKKLLIEKELKSVQEKERQERLKKLNEQIKKVAQQPLPASLIKKSSASLPQKDLTDQSRERLLQILGPKPNDELPIESHKETPIEEALILERSPSPSSSSSSDSIVEIQPPKSHNQSVVRSRSEPPIQNIDNAFEQRNQNLLRWAHNLTRDCDVIENKFKYIRPDGTQAFDIIPASFQQLQHNDGNLRTQIPIIITNNEKIDSEPIIASKILRPSGRLSHLNQNQTSEYQNQKLPGVGNLRDPILEQRIKRDRAAAKIQATYRGYTVRKSLSWINEKQNRLNSEANKRPLHEDLPITTASQSKTDIVEKRIEQPKVQPEPKISIPPRKIVSKSSASSSSSISTPTKPQESSIGEDLPITTASQSKTDIVERRIELNRPAQTKERDFFDDDSDEDEKKEPEVKLLETPREERDTQHDAQSLSIATDLAGLSDSDDDDSHKPSSSTDNEKPVLNLNTKPLSASSKSKDSESSSSTTTTASERSSKRQVQSRTSEQKPTAVTNDYDEDFSDVSHSPSTPKKESLPKIKLDDVDNESIQEDFEDKQLSHDKNHSLTSKSSGDEQSEILVLVKKSANTTPRRQDEKTIEEDPPQPSLPPPILQTKSAPINNDDTSHDISDDDDDDDDEEEDDNEQEIKIDRITDIFIRKFIDEAIDQGKHIERLKKEANQSKDFDIQEITEKKTSSPQDWLFTNETINGDSPKNIEQNEFTLDLSQLDEKNPNEPRVESPRKIVIEEPVKLFVPHTREQVTQLCHQAIDILFDQNKDFSDRLTIKSKIPNDYFTYDQQDSDSDDIRINRHAYCQMIFDLCIELLHEMYTENIIPSKYPQWQPTKLVSKRYYRGKKPGNRHDIEQLVSAKVLEILCLNNRPIVYSKWRVSNARRNGTEKFETVLDEEIRRTESQWINYSDDCLQMKFDVADLIFQQLVQESIAECLSVVDKRLFLSSNSTRL
ncbi:unnamed protein product [Adineta steineri]|uniref:DUF4378 domain-containing protein n=2 Tax=Adineta steineri TaxID=433720 RepID=A0A813MN57_9BILA|nr:unnamed protein product [Adineta steineri]